MLVVFALAASEAVLLAVVGASLVRIAVVAAAGTVFAGSYVVAAQPGRCHYEAREVRPVLAMVGASVLALAATGGMASPMLALLPAPFLVGWMMYAGTRSLRVLGAFAIATVIVFWIASSWLPAFQIDRGEYVAIAAWSTLLSLCLIGRRTRLLFDSLRSTFSKLDLVRDGALSDAASRRRGIESMSTKLAHELKNPLSAIKSLVQLELAHVKHERTQRRLEVVFAEAQRMQDIIDDYLSFSRPVDELHVGPIELDRLLDEVIALLAGRASVAGVELRLRGTGGTMVGDARLLKEALVNLASNALLATASGGVVELSYHVGRNGARIDVRDNGSGMTKDVSARIGTPFFTTRDGGTGLGVAIARSAIAQHHGQLVYDSSPGFGTTATVTLPNGAAA